MGAKVAGISFELSFDGSKLMSGINAAGKKIKNSFSRSFESAGKSASKAVGDSAREIEAILRDTEKSAKAKAASISWVYRKAGYSSEEAFKKAWSHIERDSASSSGKVKKQIKGISEQTAQTSKDVGGKFSRTFKKAGIALTGAFAVKQVIDFGRECVKLGSDLSEVQNVVDVTFPKMKAQVNDFAKSAAGNFGLSETMAKKFTGAYGAMSKSFGFTEKEAYNMSTTLTGLAGDVASFYNLSQDEAYTKLKSVFTGETETLKDLGVVMTQNALDAYAMANGYGKVTAKMSEQEKVALRYKFVQDQLSASAGDFLRTSDSWANQTRLLSLQFESLKASIGQGLINVLAPVLKVINLVIGKLSILAAKFAELTGHAFGKQDMSGAADSMGEVADGASEASENVSGVGKAAKKASKELKRSMMSFDKMNKLSDSSKDSGSGGGGSSGGASGGKTAAGASGQTEKNTGGMLDGLQKKYETLSKLFAKGFNLGAGNISGAVKSIKGHLKSIGSNLTEIFTDKAVGAAFKKMVSLFIVNAGKVVGSIASVGATIADNLLGGFDLFLQGNKEKIKKWLVSIFNISGEIAEIRGNFAVAIAEIFSVFRSADAKKLTASLFSIVYSTFAGTTELFLKIGRDILNLITSPIIENKDKIKKALENTIKPVSAVVGKIAETVSGIWDKIQATYDSKAKPLFDSLTKGISEWMGTWLNGYNQYIAPVLDRLSKRFGEVMDTKIKPALENVVTVWGKFCDTLKIVWENWLQPFVNWCIENVVPVFAKVFEQAGSSIIAVFGSISDTIKGIWDAFSGVCEIIQGIVEGDWSKIWNGAKEIVKGIFDAIKGIFAAAWNAIKTTFSPAITFFKGIWNGISGAFSKTITFFQGAFSAAWTAVKAAFSLEGVGRFFEKVWSGITGAFGSVAGWFEGVFSTAWEKVKDVFCTGSKVFSGIKEGIADVFKTVVNKIISGINKVIAIPFEKINGLLNTIRDVGVGGIKPFSGLWNKDPLPTPKIPALATGGYVKKNTPQLAMIGDNRHQGEVVAPENKLLEMARKAAEMSGDSGKMDAIIELLGQILSVLQSLDLDVYIDGEKATKRIVQTINRHTRQTGRLEIEIR